MKKILNTKCWLRPRETPNYPWLTDSNVTYLNYSVAAFPWYSVLPRLFMVPLQTPILRIFRQVTHTVSMWKNLPVGNIIAPGNSGVYLVFDANLFLRIHIVSGNGLVKSSLQPLRTNNDTNLRCHRAQGDYDLINTLRPRQNGRHFADIFKRLLWKCMNFHWHFTETNFQRSN